MLDKSVEQIKVNTRHYAKRQMTWFRKDTAVEWHNAATVDASAIATNLSK
ncbi:hypothetical protein ABTD73_20745 [Acinetobacter baumannii]